MSLWDRIRRRPPPPASPAPKTAGPLLTLQSAPAYHPLPIQSGDAIDAELVMLWSAYQRDHDAPSWSDFLSRLHADNDALTTRVQRVQTDLADYERLGIFKP